MTCVACPCQINRYVFFFLFFLTFQLSLAGVGSTVPPGSTAWTSKPCLPFLTFSVAGEAQGANASPSRLHWKVEPGSLEVNANLAFFFLVLSFGFLMIVVSGGTHPPCVSASLGHPSCVSSPNPSPSASGSTVAATLSRYGPNGDGKTTVLPTGGSGAASELVNRSPLTPAQMQYEYPRPTWPKPSRSPACTGIRVGKVLSPPLVCVFTSLSPTVR